MIKNISVYSHKDFDEKMEQMNIFSSNVCEDKKNAYISILCSKENQELFRAPHFTEETSNVIILEFDDIDCDELSHNDRMWYGITEDDAKRCVEFIMNNLGKNFIIHCNAGKSRSQGVCRFILDCFKEYGYDEKVSCRKDNPCMTPNMRVVRMLKREYYKKMGWV